MATNNTIFAWAATDVGIRRKHNEDFVLVNPEIGLYGVADGVGGYQAGEVASRMVLEGLERHLLARSDLFGFKATQGEISEEHRRKARHFIDEAVQDISYQVFSLSRQRGADFRMGSTLCAMITMNDMAIVAHVGDSRCYLFRENSVYQLTEDHSLISEQLKMGVITPEEAATSRYKNVITRAVGMADRLQVDIFFVDLIPNDRFLLCTDGFHGYLQPRELEPMMAQNDLYRLPQQGIDFANQRGGKDNITLVAILVEGMEKTRTTQIVASVTVMQHSPLFCDLSYPEILKFLSVMTQENFQPGDVILKEGDPSTHLYLVQDGELGVFRGQEFIAILGVGDYVGEMGIFDGEPVSATIVAQKTTYCLSIPGREFLSVLRQFPDIGLQIQHNLLSVLIRRLRHTSHALAWTRQEWRRQNPDQ